MMSRTLTTPTSDAPSSTGTCRTVCSSISWSTRRTESLGPQETGLRLISAVTGWVSTTGPRSVSPRTMSRSEMTPTTVLPSVRQTSLTTSAPVFSAFRRRRAVSMVSLIRTVPMRVPLRRRMSSTLMTLLL